jgi:hypothetical protein
MARAAGIILALLMGAVVWGWTPPADSPIVILDGSLTMNSAVAWNQYMGTGDVRTHPETGKAVSSIELTVDGKVQPTITFANQQCTVDVTYAGMHVQFTTGGTGQGLSFTPFSAFKGGGSPNVVAHNNQNSKITHVRILKAGARAFDGDSTGKGQTSITIHYQ